MRRLSVAGAVIVIAFVILPNAAFGSTVPLDALGAVGDEEVVLPPYSSADYTAPTATPADLGDVNGDGIDDTGTVLADWDPNAPSSAWITFSPPALPATLSAGESPWQGMRITADMLVGGVLTGLGDVNGDGLGEVVVEEELDGQSAAGYSQPFRLVVVFGRADGGMVDVDHLGDGGFYIDNVIASSAGGGYVDIHHGVTAVGDQNGDGRPDLAFSNFNRDTVDRYVEIAYTPADPAGAHVDALNLGNQGYRIAVGNSRQAGGPFVSSLGDINGDSRQDLAVFWQDGETITLSGATGPVDTHVTGVLAPTAGTTVDVRQVAPRNIGFDLKAPNTSLHDGLTVGDQNGDGEPDIGLVTTVGWPPLDSMLSVAYSPPIGTERTLRPTAPGNGVDVESEYGWATDIGDQDGDGRDDIGDGACALFSSSGFNRAANGCRISSPNHDLYLVGSTADRNGDGKRELLVVHEEGFYNPQPDSSVTWHQQIYLSASPPVPDLIRRPALVDGLLEFTGSFIIDPRGGTRTLAGRGVVRLQGGTGGAITVEGTELIDANSRYAEATVDVDPKHEKLVYGRPYQYEMALENNRGLVGTSSPRWFVYGGPSQLHLVAGTVGGDRLRGTSHPDLVQAQGGNDTIYVRGGGPDYVLCGGGLDRVAADARDHLYGCERKIRRS